MADACLLTHRLQLTLCGAQGPSASPDLYGLLLPRAFVTCVPVPRLLRVLAQGIGKMLGPALLAPLLAWALSMRPAATYSPSGALLVFFGLSALVLTVGVLGAFLPRDWGEGRESGRERGGRHKRRAAAPTTDAHRRFQPLEEESSVPTPVSTQTREPTRCTRTGNLSSYTEELGSVASGPSSTELDPLPEMRRDAHSTA